MILLSPIVEFTFTFERDFLGVEFLVDGVLSALCYLTTPKLQLFLWRRQLLILFGLLVSIYYFTLVFLEQRLTVPLRLALSSLCNQVGPELSAILLPQTPED